MLDHLCDEEFGQTLEWQTVITGADALLHGAFGALHFTNVVVGGHDLEVNGSKIGADTFKLLIAVNVTNDKTAAGMKSDDGLELGQDGGMFSVRDRRRSLKLEVARDGVEKREALDNEKIDTQDNGAIVVFMDMRRYRDGFETRNARSLAGTGSLTFEGGHVRAVDDSGAFRVGGSDGTVEDGVGSQQLQAFSLTRAAKESVQPACVVGL